MRISDWSSDVCSSDLVGVPAHRTERPFQTSAHAGPTLCLVEAVGLSLQIAIGLREAIKLMQVVATGRTVIQIGPQLRIDDVEPQAPVARPIAHPSVRALQNLGVEQECQYGRHRVAV